jgi:leucyl aminopeptidase
MLARLTRTPALLDETALRRYAHILIVLPWGRDADALPDFPRRAPLEAALGRRKMKFEDLGKTPLALHLEHGGLCAYVMIDRNKPRFEQLTALRKAIGSLLEEQPRSIAIGVFGDEALRQALAREALYVAWINGARLPVRKSKDEGRPLERIGLFGASGDFDDLAALARANILARELTMLPPNELTPRHYRERLRSIARSQHWRIEEFDYGKLRKMGAGAFTAVAQGSDERDAAIVHLTYAPKNAQLTVALVGKGICFDTGGHNLKTAKYMAGMHEDMNGSAVALGLMQALAEQDFPLRVDAWLALAQNHLSPAAYKQNDVVRALDGTTIEIVHTDAEGRMVLADTLTMASREAPHLIVDFATLTGSMHSALGTRYSGVFASEDGLGRLAVEAGQASGERVCLFPMDTDYEEALDSKVADVKQCTMEGEADHILAARFLKRFTHDKPWLHVDLSASNSSGGLGAVASDVTGFGVAWGVELLKRWLETKPAAAKARRRKG